MSDEAKRVHVESGLLGSGSLSRSANTSNANNARNVNSSGSNNNNNVNNGNFVAPDFVFRIIMPRC